eukprot:15482685-Alexandrium_andersonii.AAC.1
MPAPFVCCWLLLVCSVFPCLRLRLFFASRHRAPLTADRGAFRRREGGAPQVGGRAVRTFRCLLLDRARSHGRGPGGAVGARR